MDWLSLLIGLGTSLLPGLFGEGSQQPDIVKTSALTPEQERIMRQLADVIGGRLGTTLPAYPYSLATQPTQLQTQVMASIADLVGTPMFTGLPEMPTYQAPVGGAWSSALERVLSGLPAYEVRPEATEEFYRSAVEAPALRTFQEQILPTVREEFVGPGTYWSTMRQQAEQKAAADLATALTGERARLMYADEQARRAAAEAGAQRAAQALPSALSFALESAWQPFQAGMATRQQAVGEQTAARQGWLEALQSAWQMGTGLQQLEQANRLAEYNEWLRQQAESSPYLQMALQFLGIPAIAAYQPPYQPSPWAELLKLVGTVGAGWAQGGFKWPSA